MARGWLSGISNINRTTDGGLVFCVPCLVSGGVEWARAGARNPACTLAMGWEPDRRQVVASITMPRNASIETESRQRGWSEGSCRPATMPSTRARSPTSSSTSGPWTHPRDQDVANEEEVPERDVLWGGHEPHAASTWDVTPCQPSPATSDWNTLHACRQVARIAEHG